MWGEECEQTKKWLADQLHQLKHDGPSALFSEVMELRNQKPALEVLQKNQAYLEKRSDHMQYPRCQAQHLPMESGNKVVVEARLKGAGMRWTIPHVNPMLALRNIFCSEHWQEGWQQITITLRQQEHQRRKELHQKHNHDAQQRLPQPPIKCKSSRLYCINRFLLHQFLLNPTCRNTSLLFLLPIVLGVARPSAK